MRRRLRCASRTAGRPGPGHPRPGKAETGFTVVEVAVAALVVSVVGLALAAVMTKSLASAQLSRQSQQASNIAASAVAEVEALSWGNGTQVGAVSYGLSTSSTSDPAYSGDSNISSTGSAAGNQCFEGMPLIVGGAAPSSCPSGSAQGGPSYAWQAVPVSSCTTSVAALVTGSASGTAPLVPHVACVTLNGTSFQLAVYPTVFPTSATWSPSTTGAQVEVTTVVTWTAGSAAMTGLKRVTDTVVLTNCGAGAVRCS